MAAKVTLSANDGLNYFLRNVAPSWGGSGTVYLSGHTAAVGLGGTAVTNEIAYTGYGRVALTRSSGGAFTAAASAASSNNALVQFGICTGGTLPVTMTHVSIVTTSSGAGDVIYTGALDSPLVINLNTRPEFDIGSLVVAEA
jgi:predicted membrane-bound mannosyltransferase